MKFMCEPNMFWPIYLYLMMRVITAYGRVIKQKNFNIKMVDTFLLQFHDYKNMTF